MPKFSFTCLIFSLCAFSMIAQDRLTDSLRNELKQQRNDTGMVKTLNLLSRVVKRTDSKEAYRLAQSALTLASKLEYQMGLANTYNLLGAIHDDRGHSDSALAYYRRSLDLFTVLKNDAGVGRCYNNIGLTQLNMGRYTEALSNLLKGLEIREKIGDKKGVAGSYNNIGMLFDEQKNYGKALEYYELSFRIKLELGDKQGLANALMNIGLCYGNAGDLEKEYEYYKRALAIQKELRDKIGMSMAYNNIGENLFTQKKYSEASAYLEKALVLRKDLADERGIALSLSNLGKVLVAEKKYDRAVAVLQTALEYAKRGRDLKELKLAYFGLSRAYSGKGDLAKALSMQQLYSAYSDSLLSEENTRQVAEMQTRYETEKKDQQNLVLQEENKAKTAEIEKSRLQNYILIAALILIGTALYFFYYTGKLRNKLRESEARQKLQEERERISRDLHDNVGSQLSYIVSGIDTQAERNRHLQSISEAAVQTMANLRETIWALHHETISADDLGDKIKKYIAQRLSLHETPLPEISVEAFTAELSQSEALNVYRIAQEAVNNAVKYSGAQLLRVDLRANRAGKLKMTVKDNGVGFDISAVKDEAYGLKNMRHRAKEINAMLKIESVINKGTEIELTL